MPGKWIKRDPDNPAQVWDELTEDEMSALLRKSNPQSPEYREHLPRDASRVFLIDNKIVGVEIIGKGIQDSRFVWEFDLYEGWAEQGRTEPASLSLTEPAQWAGMSVLDFIAASGATTTAAWRMMTAERNHALQVCSPLVAAFSVLLDTSHTPLPNTTRQWYSDRCAQLQAVTLENLGRLTGGDVKRAGQLLDEAIITRASLSDALDRMRDVWRLQDYALRFPAQAANQPA